MAVVDLNADVGEGEAETSDGDALLMPFVTSANVACGAHAGSAEVMDVTIRLAIQHGVRIGAHPSFDDPEHFGRRERDVDTGELQEAITVQVRRLAKVASQHRVRLQHVKPHGALYNMAARDPRVAEAIARAVAELDGTLALVGLAGSELIAAGSRLGLQTVSEAFADRAYRPDGSLVPRALPGAVLEDAEVVTARAVAMVRDQRVIAIDGSAIPVTVETLCIHGDTPGAATLARRTREALELSGVQVRAFR